MRTKQIADPSKLTDVLTNIIHELEEHQQSAQDDLIIQALLALQAMSDRLDEQVKRIADELSRRGAADVGPRIGG